MSLLAQSIPITVFLLNLLLDYTWNIPLFTKRSTSPPCSNRELPSTNIQRVLRHSKYAPVGVNLLSLFNWASDPSALTKKISIYWLWVTRGLRSHFPQVVIKYAFLTNNDLAMFSSPFIPRPRRWTYAWEEELVWNCQPGFWWVLRLLPDPAPHLL